MQNDLDALLRDGTIVRVALAIALGWALFQVAEGVSTLVSYALLEPPAGFGAAQALRYSEPLVWEVGDGRFLVFGPVFQGVVEFAVVLAVALFVRRRAVAEEEFEERRGQ